MQFRPTAARIDLEALKHNCRQLRKLQARPEDFFCPMVKADAYGHGDIEITQTLLSEGVTHVGVALVEEGLRLREQLGIGFSILVFGPLTEDGARAAVEGDLTPVLSSWSEIETLEKNLYQKAHFRVHIKFNVGMSRLGFHVDEAEKVARYFRDNDRFSVEGVCAHLSDGEDGANPNGRTAAQLQKFFMAARSFRGSAPNDQVHFHALNSAALISAHCALQKNHLTFGARPGISLYGIKQDILGASEEALARWQEVELKPVLSLVSRICHTQKVKAGEAVSYNGTWIAPRDAVVAVVPIGYADGLSRLLSNKGRMLFRGEEVPIVGAICMDYTMVDVTPFVDGSTEICGEDVVIIGRQNQRELKAEHLAQIIGTNPYEVFTSVSRRVPRVYR